VNPVFSNQVGTRHRAGIGITEETDCLSLIVSEETGSISIAAFSEIERNVTIDRVDQRINEHFGVSPKHMPDWTPHNVPQRKKEDAVETTGGQSVR
jgi:diadenylate cyclase